MPFRQEKVTSSNWLFCLTTVFWFFEQQPKSQRNIKWIVNYIKQKSNRPKFWRAGLKESWAFLSDKWLKNWWRLCLPVCFCLSAVEKGYVLRWRRQTQTTRWTCQQFSNTCCWTATCFHPPDPGLHVRWTDSSDDDHPVVDKTELNQMIHLQTLSSNHHWL